MVDSHPTTPAMPHSPRRRGFDLLVIMAIACGLLWLAWQVARERGRSEEPLIESPLAPSAAGPTLPETPELQMVLPLERFGMGLTRQHVSGDEASALAALDQQCQEVLASSDEWVLSLAVSSEELQLLDSLTGTMPLERPASSSSARIYPLQQPTGRAGVRQALGAGAVAGRRLLCWGFILPEGEAGYTVWFARPRERLSRTQPTEGHSP